MKPSDTMPLNTGYLSLEEIEKRYDGYAVVLYNTKHSEQPHRLIGGEVYLTNAAKAALVNERASFVRAR